MRVSRSMRSLVGLLLVILCGCGGAGAPGVTRAEAAVTVDGALLLTQLEGVAPASGYSFIIVRATLANFDEAAGLPTNRGNFALLSSSSSTYAASPNPGALPDQCPEDSVEARLGAGEQLSCQLAFALPSEESASELVYTGGGSTLTVTLAPAPPDTSETPCDALGSACVVNFASALEGDGACATQYAALASACDPGCVAGLQDAYACPDIQGECVPTEACGRAAQALGNCLAVTFGGVCTGEGSPVVGASCAMSSDCGPALACLTDANGFPNGYCTASCASVTCPADSVCATVASSGLTACMNSCADASDCRTGYSCCFSLGSVCAPTDFCPGSLTTFSSSSSRSSRHPFTNPSRRLGFAPATPHTTPIGDPDHVEQVPARLFDPLGRAARGSRGSRRRTVVRVVHTRQRRRISRTAAPAGRWWPRPAPQRRGSRRRRSRARCARRSASPW